MSIFRKIFPKKKKPDSKKKKQPKWIPVLPKGFQLVEKESDDESAVIRRKEGAVELRITQYADGTFDGSICISREQNPRSWRCGTHPKPKYSFETNTLRRNSMEKLLLYLTDYAHRMEIYMNHIDSILSIRPEEGKTKEETLFLRTYQECIYARMKDPKGVFSLASENLMSIDLEVATKMELAALEKERVRSLLNTYPPQSAFHHDYAECLNAILHPEKG